MKQAELNNILESHKLWLDNKGGKRANLRDANLMDANLRDTDLSEADLRDANLSYANLSYANLRDANLWHANLSEADLRDANLSYANLRDANLSYADLRDANLRDTDLRGCAGNRSEIKSIFISDKYPITYTSEYLQIGCKRHLITDWWSFDDDIIQAMDDGALEWWVEWKDIIKTLIEKAPATKTGHES